MSGSVATFCDAFKLANLAICARREGKKRVNWRINSDLFVKALFDNLFYFVLRYVRHSNPSRV